MLLAVLSSVLAIACPAQQTEDAPTARGDPRPLWSLVERGAFTELEAILQRAQSAFEANTKDSGELEWTYGVVAMPETRWARRLDEWIEKHPQSHAAHTARGIYRKRLGTRARGSRYIHETSPEQIREMVAHFERANRDLRRAMELHSRPYVAYNHLMDISGHLGDPADTRAIFDRARSIAPANAQLRVDYANWLKPRWGGSYAKIAALVEESRKAGMQPAELARLSAIVPRDRASAASGSGDRAEAIRFYTEAIAVHEAPNSLCTRGALYRLQRRDDLAKADFERGIRVEPRAHYCYTELAILYRDRAEPERALEHYTLSLKIWPFNTLALNQRGYLLGRHFNRHAEGFADVLLSAQLRNWWAQQQVAKLYLDGVGTPRDRDKALRWFERCAQNDDESNTQAEACRKLAAQVARG